MKAPKDRPRARHDKKERQLRRKLGKPPVPSAMDVRPPLMPGEQTDEQLEESRVFWKFRKEHSDHTVVEHWAAEQLNGILAEISRREMENAARDPALEEAVRNAQAEMDNIRSEYEAVLVDFGAEQNPARKIALRKRSEELLDKVFAAHSKFEKAFNRSQPVVRIGS